MTEIDPSIAEDAPAPEPSDDAVEHPPVNTEPLEG